MVKARVPEGGAIEDTEEMDMEEYSQRMKKMMGHEYREFVAHIVNVMNPPQGGKVLEIGPGPGWIGIWLAKARPDLEIIGLEPSPDMRRVASQNAKEEGVFDRIRYQEGFVEDMTCFSDNEFDAVFSNDSLHHWEHPTEGFQEIDRVLKPEGTVRVADERRDLGLGGKFILYFLGRLIAGKTWKHWKASVDSSYTTAEIQSIIQDIPRPDWIVKTNVMGLQVENSICSE